MPADPELKSRQQPSSTQALEYRHPGRSNVPADPNTMLVQRGHAPVRQRPNLVLWLIMLALAGEMFAPETFKPSSLASAATARFYRDVMDEANRKQLELEEQEAIARTLAEREAEYGAWLGRCAMVSLFDPQAGAMCRQAAEAFYREAIDEARRARERFTQKKNQ